MDRQLVERAQRGDEDAFASLAGGVIDRLHAIAQHVLRDPDLAADATQQALLDIWRRLPQLRDPERFEAWACRIVVRAAYEESHRRSLWRVRASALAETGAVAGRGGTTPDPAANVADRERLERGFARLSFEHRTVIVLKHYLGLDDREAADVLDVAEGTVRSRHFHALRALRAALDADARAGRVPEPIGVGR